LHAHPDFTKQAAALLHRVQSSTPIFDKTAEDGARFRIYQVGSVEIRTCQERDDSEEVGAVFSMRASRPDRKPQNHILQDSVAIKKATQYVEQDLSSDSSYCFFLVLETENGDHIVTERLMDGSAIWEENPDDFEDRCSWAKSLRSREALPGLSVRDMKVYSDMMIQALADDAAAPCKNYARSLYLQAVASSQGSWTLSHNAKVMP
jgi:hypothetical protein